MPDFRIFGVSFLSRKKKNEMQLKLIEIRLTSNPAFEFEVLELLLECEDGIRILSDAAKDELTEEIRTGSQDPGSDGLHSGFQSADVPRVMDASLKLSVELFRLSDPSSYTGQRLIHLSLTPGSVFRHGSIRLYETESGFLIRLKLLQQFPP